MIKMYFNVKKTQNTNGALLKVTSYEGKYQYY